MLQASAPAITPAFREDDVGHVFELVVRQVALDFAQVAVAGVVSRTTDSFFTDRRDFCQVYLYSSDEDVALVPAGVVTST